MDFNEERFKVMFVDDEDKIRKLLRICIDWETLGFEVIADASSANHALELIAVEKPDIIITDIEMPYINGLDFAEIVSWEYPGIKTVILTAHSDFNYAKKGVDIGISGFLLKPIRREEITEVMKNLRQVLIEEKRQLFEYESLKSRLRDNWDYIVQNFLNNLLLSKFSQESLEDNLRFYKVPLHINTGYYNVLLLSPVLDTGAEENILQLFKCQKIISSMLNKTTGVVLFIDFQQNIIMISENKKINLYAYASHIVAMLSEKLKIDIYYGVGVPVEHLTDIRSSYKHAYNGVQISKFSQGKSFVINGSSENQYTKLSDILKSVDEDISLYLKIPIENKVIDRINSIYTMIQNSSGIEFSNVMIFSLSLVNIILNTVNDMGINYTEIYQTDHLPYAHILKLTDIKSIKDYIINFVQFTIQQIEKFNQSQGNQLISSIIQYINENISDSTLSLKKISDMNYINSSYLSRIFKAVTGTAFIDYLINIRIEKAKKLLIGSNLKIYEIAEQIGINDPNYFSKYFKKHTGYTPAQFKELNIKM